MLCFAPHPDDEVAGPGGALALHRLAGDPVRVVVATDGRAGDPEQRFPPADYTQLRAAESSQALALLGVDELRCWGFPDSAVLRGLRAAGFTGTMLGYEIWSAMLPDVLLDITPVAEQKWRALGCYATQLAYFDLVDPIRGLNRHRALLGARGPRYAEAFLRLATGRRA